MITAILPEHRAQYARELRDMHQLRYRVFHERLGWEVTTVADMEMDSYDAMKPIYVLYRTPSGDVGGCARLLPSMGPNMLAHTFPVLLDGKPAPEAPLVWESSRFAVDFPISGRDPQKAVARATIELFAGIIELGLALGWQEIVTVTDLRLEKVGRRCGLPFQRLGTPHQIGKTQAIAVSTVVNTEVLEALQAAGGLSDPVLEISKNANQAMPQEEKLAA